MHMSNDATKRATIHITAANKKRATEKVVLFHFSAAIYLLILSKSNLQVYYMKEFLHMW